MKKGANLGLINSGTVRNLSLLLGLVLFSLIAFIYVSSDIFSKLELRVLDNLFLLKESRNQSTQEEGVVVHTPDIRLSDDILIVGIDSKTLNLYETWPFPRYAYANFFYSLSRIKNQNERENSIFFDVFMSEKSPETYNDVLLADSLRENGRVIMEPVLEIFPSSSDSDTAVINEGLEFLFETHGSIEQISGDFTQLPCYYSGEPSLKPFVEQIADYGHPNFLSDDDKKFRRVPLIIRYSVFQESFILDDFSPSIPLDRDNFEHFIWVDNEGVYNDLPYPLDQKKWERLKKTILQKGQKTFADTDGNNEADTHIFYIKKYKDYLIPAISLKLAAHYFGQDVNDFNYELGNSITINNPTIVDESGEKRVSYSVPVKEAFINSEGEVEKEEQRVVLPSIEIPIDSEAYMHVNFMGRPSTADRGGYQTFPIRSMSGYSRSVPDKNPEKWPKTKKLENKIVMVGAFTKGIALDVKNTPLGLMYGVELHANALNTIIMDNFLNELPHWQMLFISFVIVMLFSFLVSRVNPWISSLVLLLFILLSFIGIYQLFLYQGIILSFSLILFSAILAFLSSLVLRVLVEEGDKRKIKNVFGKYVSPTVVEQIIENPPELGGIDKDTTIFFSDIRAFTSLSEMLTPQELVDFLNEYMTAMTDCLLKNKGTLDKYIGDAIMAFWGAPLEQENHAELACRCAVEQYKILQELNKKWPPHMRIKFGIGINSGVSTVGNIGSEGRMNFTIMGDNVNLASRLESINKQYYTSIVISESTYLKIKDRGFITRELDFIRVKGKRRPIKIYELLDVEK